MESIKKNCCPCLLLHQNFDANVICVKTPMEQKLDTWTRHAWVLVQLTFFVNTITVLQQCHQYTF